jgi:hypothetical protein
MSCELRLHSHGSPRDDRFLHINNLSLPTIAQIKTMQSNSCTYLMLLVMATYASQTAPTISILYGLVVPSALTKSSPPGTGS